MRVLVATTANAGHFGPMVPFARACAAAGHDVRVAAPASFAAAVEKVKLTHAPVPDAPEAEWAAISAALPELSLEEANRMVAREVFAGVHARAALPAMVAIVRDFRPDLILRETAECASYVVADQHDVPHVHVAIGLARVEAFVYPLLGDALAGLGSASGVSGLEAAPVLSLVPASLESAPPAVGRRVHRFRYEMSSTTDQGLPPRWGDPDTPLVYVTFGTVAAKRGLYPDLYRAAIDATAGLPIRVLATVGDAADPYQLGPVPANVHVERFWPQQEVMAHASSMVGHGGFGTTMAALAHGVPMVNIPLFAIDQHYNAEAVAKTGAGVTLDSGPTGMDALAEGLERTLNEPSYRSCAHTIATEIAELPLPSASISVLEDIAQG